MNDGMAGITSLDSVKKKRFLRIAHRLILAHEQIHRSFHARPIQQDVFAEVDAIFAWSVVTCSYSGIEQTMKCLLQMQDNYVDKQPYEGGDRHHHIGKLFKKLTDKEKSVLRVSFNIYRSLHDYIPKETADDFLDAIDEGYESWRYFLLDGSKNGKWPPTTHPGAMLEIWAALCDILRARQFTNHGLQSVERRIFSRLRNIHEDAIRQILVVMNTAEINALFQWRRSEYERDINAYASLIYCHGKGEPLLIDERVAAFPGVLITSPVLHKFVENAEQDESNDDLVYFVDRAKTNGIAWNPCKKQFEAV